jgi:hexosaminidase
MKFFKNINIFSVNFNLSNHFYFFTNMKWLLLISFFIFLSAQNLKENSNIENYITFPVWPLPEKIEKIGPNGTYVISNFKDFSISSNIENPILTQAITKYKKIIFSSEKPVSTTCDKCVKGLQIQVEEKDSPLDQNMNEEYFLSLDISRETFVLKSKSIWGSLRGLETFSQLVELENRQYIMKNINVFISDKPRFSWRGFMIDTSRHYLDLKTILKTVEVMSYHKLNVLHWHIVDDEAFPYVVRITKNLIFKVQDWPNLSGSGAYAKKAIYSREDVKKVVDYAKNLGIRVIPEFDMPGLLLVNINKIRTHQKLGFRL